MADKGTTAKIAVGRGSASTDATALIVKNAGAGGSVNMVDSALSAKIAEGKEFVSMVGGEISVKSVGAVPFAFTDASNIPAWTAVEMLSVNMAVVATNAESVEVGGSVNTAVYDPNAETVGGGVFANMDA
uniref:Uncharacterized protein n=1 Tax=Chromera velia CCMP2878 TaxID=1169474 RepID=A0A0G4FP92_9ALVE|eukprot:Cvel_18051.t1-p1 / transcript=Cvel_18051.t1 / gene=Cvel_18051 / organism=Chromera_velia_CCMP2878 / gene_product=Zinc finger protein 571, putative / transcript_product=Zinc finger protein 571, putative / location=Cvel_scaffold1474:31458-31844(-) / protein_length=129 / sequence_SO=supercontig / SO=protein_coding / is_pseudo=false